jgi:hypothetical protein
MPDETLRLKDIDPSEFAAQVSQAVIDHTTKKYGIVFCRKMWGGRKGKEALTEVFRLAKDIAIAARDNTWPRKTRADDAVAAVSSLVYGQLLDDPKYAGIDRGYPAEVAMFARLYADAPLTGKCNDLVKFVFSCVALRVAIELGHEPSPEAVMDLSSKTIDEAMELANSGEIDRVLEWSASKPVGDA